MLMLILGISLVTYVVTITYVGRTMSQKSIADAKKLADLGTLEKASRIQADFEGYLSLSRALSMLVQDYLQLPATERFEQERQLLIQVQNSNAEFKQVWISWDMKAADPKWAEEPGRLRHAFTRLQDGGQNEFSDNTYDPESFYYTIKATGKEGAAEPYTFAPNKWPGLLGTSIVSPISREGQYLGQVGFDFATDRYLNTTEFDAFERSYALVISFKGNVVAHPDPQLINDYVNQISFIANQDPEVLRSQLASGNAMTFEDFDAHTGEQVYVNLRQVPIGNSDMFWTVGTVVPLREINAASVAIIRDASLIGITGLLLLALAIWLITQRISGSLHDSEQLLQKLAKGEVDEHQLTVTGTDELSRITRSVNTLLLDLAKKAAFAREIGKGNLESAFETSGPKDQLGQSLLQMRSNLMGVIEEVNAVVTVASTDGDLSSRITTQEKLGIWQELTQAINELLASFHQPFVSISNLAHQMAKGDLSERLDGEMKGDVNELAQNLNLALENLAMLLAKVIDRAHEIGVSAGNMLGASDEMQQNTSEIAQAIQEMSSGSQSQVQQTDHSSQLIEKIRQSAVDMESQARQINQSAATSTEKSQLGMERIAKVDLSMKDISMFSERTNASFQTFADRSQEISRVLGVITEIASQTNLLALNAAIEAAQAGDAGRGFAVVADEIRKLAEDSRNSARSIAELVEAVQEDSSEAAKVLISMNERIAAGEKASGEASEAFQEIAQATDETLQLAGEIFQSSTSQKDDIREIVGITESVVVIAEETAAGTEEVASSATQLASGMVDYKTRSQELADISQQLVEAIGKFKLGGSEQAGEDEAPLD